MTTNVSADRMRLTEQVAEEIRALLARRRLSGRELARRMGASASWVNFRLTGSVEIGLNDLERFADALEVDAHDLMPQREGRLIAVARTNPNQGQEITSRKPLMPKGSSPLRPIRSTGGPNHTPSNRRTGRITSALIAA